MEKLAENGFVALQHGAVHVAELALIEIKCGMVQGCPVVPKQDIAQFPFMAVVKFGLIAMGIEFIHEGKPFFVLHAIDVFDSHLIQIERFAICFRVQAN